MISEFAISEYAISEAGYDSSLVYQTLAFNQTALPNLVYKIQTSQKLRIVEYLVKEWIKPTSDRLSFRQTVDASMPHKLGIVNHRLRLSQSLIHTPIRHQSATNTLVFVGSVAADIPNKPLAYNQLLFTQNVEVAWKQLRFDISQRLTFNQELNIYSYNASDSLIFTQTVSTNWKFVTATNSLVFSQTALAILRILEPNFQQALNFNQTVRSNIQPIAVAQVLTFNDLAEHKQKRFAISQTLTFNSSIRGYTPKGFELSHALNFQQNSKTFFVFVSASNNLSFNDSVSIKRVFNKTVCQCLVFNHKTGRIKEKSVSQTLTFVQGVKRPTTQKLTFIQTVATNAIYAACCNDTYIPDKKITNKLNFTQAVVLKNSDKKSVGQSISLRQTVFWIKG